MIKALIESIELYYDAQDAWIDAREARLRHFHQTDMALERLKTRKNNGYHVPLAELKAAMQARDAAEKNLKMEGFPS